MTIKRLLGIALLGVLVTGALGTTPADAGSWNLPSDVRAWFMGEGPRHVSEAIETSDDEPGGFYLPEGSAPGRPVWNLAVTASFLSSDDPTAQDFEANESWTAAIMADDVPVGTLRLERDPDEANEFLWAIDDDGFLAGRLDAGTSDVAIIDTGAAGLFVLEGDVVTQVDFTTGEETSVQLDEFQSALIAHEAELEEQSEANNGEIIYAGLPPILDLKGVPGAVVRPPLSTRDNAHRRSAAGAGIATPVGGALVAIASVFAMATRHMIAGPIRRRTR
ncbi:MAG: hypothetical protein FWD59_04610 [Micrococcales bacterium]|nr:hypothetical protein [Micrococcales bacterium]